MIPVDLLIVGGLTLDRAPDGSLAPGGSVLHGTRAARGAGWRVAAVSSAGPEAEARRGAAELANPGPCRIGAAPATARFAIDEATMPRRLQLEVAAPPMRWESAWDGAWAPAAILAAPVTGELGPDLLAALPRGGRRVAILQGWLRRADPDGAVRATPVGEIEAGVLGWLRVADALVASREDLLAGGADPLDQIRALRTACGPGPALIITLGPDGFLLEFPGQSAHRHPAPRVVRTATTVGAGDAFAALLAAQMGAGAGVEAAAEAAAAGVAALLERRRT